MTILENLKRIFEGKFTDIFNNNNFRLFDFSRNNSYVLEVKGSNRLSIDLSKATTEERRLLKEKILDVEIEDNGNLLTEKSLNKTKQIKHNLPTDADQELLKFYKDKLSLDMYKALEASIIVRNAFKNGEDIIELKSDISSKYPEFGNNLCNLTSQGYFDNHFKDLYYSMLEEDDFDIVSYQNKIKKVVKALPYTVFITRFKSYDELNGEVIFKMKKLRIYGTGQLLLHGIGKENVSTCLNILDEYKDDDKILIEKEINASKTIITATLKFL